MTKHGGRAFAPVLITAALMLAGCGGLPRSIRQEIASEKSRLLAAGKQLRNAQDTLKNDLTGAPELFRGSTVETEWPARLRAAKAKLDSAENDESELEKLHSDTRDSILRAERLLSDERQLRESALRDAESVLANVRKWIDFEHNTTHYVAKMQHEYDTIRAVDLTPVATVVEKAEQDWPAKKSDLDSRFASLRQVPRTAETEWSETKDARQAAANGKAGAPQIAALVQADDTLAAESASLPQQADQLREMCGQLYNAWDKVLDDLEVTHLGPDTVYREKLKTVQTHFVDVAAKQTETSSDVKWVDVSPGQYREAENDLGMAISHKDAGLYDSEAHNIAQPPGYAYIAPPDVGSNQYGYWSHTDHGSFWTFLPQYLIMRELLWGHSYRPVVINEYNSYYQAQRSGRTWYGQETPSSPPKYGTHGTFTQQRYASSRYAQSGGYKGSAYASHGSAGAPSENGPRRFGNGADSPQSGRRFGSGSSGSSRPPPSGRRFGGGSRSFGSRRR